MKKYLARNLAKTRFYIDGMEHLFTECAIREGHAYHDAKKLWQMIGAALEENIGMNVNEEMAQEKILKAIEDNPIDTDQVLALCSRFRHLCSEIIRLNASYNPSDRRYLIGVLGE